MQSSFILIFLAVASVAYLGIMLFFRAMQERKETKSSPMDEQLRKLITPIKLLQLRFYVACSVACAFIVILMLFGVEKMAIILPISAAAALGGQWLAREYFIWKIRRRQRRINSSILNLTIGLANCMKSGLGLGQAVESLARRMQGPIQEELQVVLQEHRVGVGMAEAFERFYQRAPSEDLHLLVTTISLTIKSGGSMVEVLEQIVSTIRSRTEFEEHLLNMTAQGRFEALVLSSIPVVAFFLLYIVDPDLMRPLVTTGYGWCAIGVAAILVISGYYVTRKIITVKV